MFFQDRETTLKGIAVVGSGRCCYLPGAGNPDEWVKPTALCDCKYGVTDPGLNHLSEQTGCPELRSMYKLLESMTDEEYNTFVDRAGGIRTWAWE